MYSGRAREQKWPSLLLSIRVKGTLSLLPRKRSLCRIHAAFCTHRLIFPLSRFGLVMVMNKAQLIMMHKEENAPFLCFALSYAHKHTQKPRPHICLERKQNGCMPFGSPGKWILLAEQLAFKRESNLCSIHYFYCSGRSFSPNTGARVYACMCVFV